MVGGDDDGGEEQKVFVDWTRFNLPLLRDCWQCLVLLSWRDSVFTW